MAFGPGGVIAVGFRAFRSGQGYRGVGGVALLDAKGERLRPSRPWSGRAIVHRVAFGPGGVIAAGTAPTAKSASATTSAAWC